MYRKQTDREIKEDIFGCVKYTHSSRSDNGIFTIYIKFKTDVQLIYARLTDIVSFLVEFINSINSISVLK